MSGRIDTTKLETEFLDKSSLSELLETLGAIAMEKAEHISSNWQDAPLAKSWERDAQIIFTAANKMRN